MWSMNCRRNALLACARNSMSTTVLMTIRTELAFSLASNAPTSPPSPAWPAGLRVISATPDRGPGVRPFIRRRS